MFDFIPLLILHVWFMSFGGLPFFGRVVVEPNSFNFLIIDLTCLQMIIRVFYFKTQPRVVYFP